MPTDKETANMSEEGYWPPTAIKEHWPPVPVKDDAAFYNVAKPPRPDVSAVTKYVSAVTKYGSTIHIRQDNYGWVWEATSGDWHKDGSESWCWLAIRAAKKAVRKRARHAAEMAARVERRKAGKANVTFKY